MNTSQKLPIAFIKKMTMKKTSLATLMLITLILVRCGGPPPNLPSKGVSPSTTQSKEIAGLVKAEATYEYEKTMYTDSIHRIEFVISKDLDRELIYEYAPTFENSDKLKDEIAYVGDIVAADLIDPTNGQNFQITPLSIRVQQVFSKDTFGYLWQWDVIPLKSGKLPLRLRAFTKIGDVDVNIPIFDTDIEVVSNKDEISQVTFIIGGFITIFLIGFGTFFLRKKKVINQSKDVIPKELSEELKSLIGNDKTAIVFDKLESYLKEINSERLEDLIVLKSSFNRNKRKSNLNVIDSDEENIERSRINLAIIELINEMKTEVNKA